MRKQSDKSKMCDTLKTTGQKRKGEKRKHKTTGFNSSNKSKAEQNNTKRLKRIGEI